MRFRDYKNKILKEDKSFNEEYLDKKIDFEFEIANLISEARLYKELTQKELAQLLKTQQPSIARLEKGEKLPSLTFLKKVADALNTYLIVKFGFMEENIKITTGNVKNTIEDSSTADIQMSPYFNLKTNFNHN